MKIYFDNNFYFNKFIYLFLFENLNNFVSFKTLVLKIWLIQTVGCFRCSLSRVLFDWLHDCSDRVVKKVANYIGMTVLVFAPQYVSGPIFAKLANLIPAVNLRHLWRRKFFQWNAWNSKDPPSSCYSWLDFLSFTLYLRTFWNCSVYFSGWQRVHRQPKATVCAKIHS